MFSQVLKVQINLYSHREKDNLIIENLDLKNVSNINNHIKDTLYNICSGNINTPVIKDSEEISKLKNEISVLKNEVNSLRNEIISLNTELEVSQKENELLEIKLKNNITNTKEIKRAIEIEDSNIKEAPKNKMSNKLISSVNKIDI